MCKLYIVAGRLSPLQTRAIITAVNSVFSDSQPDGFGFVAFGDDGTVAHGRYAGPRDYLGFGFSVPSFIDQSAIETGTLPKVTTALVIHGRTATNQKVLQNSHPFRSGNVYLAHNGVLRWKGATADEPKAPHGCDTEQFLMWLMSQYQGDVVNAFDGSEKMWSGYGVFGVIDADKQELVVGKCGAGNLSWATDGKNHFFTTQGDDLHKIAFAAKLRPARAAAMRKNTLVRFKVNGARAAMDHIQPWAGFGSVTYDSSYFRSMGDDDGDWRSGGGYGYHRQQHALPSSPAPTTTTQTTSSHDTRYNRFKKRYPSHGASNPPTIIPLDRSGEVKVAGGFTGVTVPRDPGVVSKEVGAAPAAKESFPDFTPSTSTAPADHEEALDAAAAASAAAHAAAHAD